MKNYIGDIYMITSVDKDKLDFLKKYDTVDSDYLCACKYILAMKDVSLIKYKGKYIDSTLISKVDSNNIDNNNLFMVDEIYDPYIGELFVRNLRRVKSLTKKY